MYSNRTDGENRTHGQFGAGGKMHIITAKESIHTGDAKKLLDELSDALQKITGCSGRASFDVSDMDNPGSVFAVAREDGTAAGCGAYRAISADTAEIKRMYVRKKSSGIGRQILSFLEQQARESGYGKTVLETRKCNQKAVGFYLRNGYQIIPNYGKYANRPEAVCFEKILSKTELPV